MIVSASRRTFVSAAIICTILPQALPSPFLPTLSQLKQLPLQFQQSLRHLLGQKGPIVTYKGRPTTLPPTPWSQTKRPRPSSQQHQQDLNQLLDYQPEEVDGGEKRPEGAKQANPWGGLPSLSGQLVSVTTSNAILDDNVEILFDSDNDADGLFREDVLLGRPLHDKKINKFRNRL